MRRRELDLVKGFGIVVVVLAHMHFADGVVNKFGCVFISIFFVVSGILHRQGVGPMELLRRRLSTLMVPYLVFGGAYLAVYTIRSLPDTRVLFDGLTTLLVYPTRAPVGESTLWFLPVMLVCSVVYCALNRACMSPAAMTVAVCALGLSMLVVCGITRLEIPWGIASACTMLPFYHLGVLVERHKVLELMESRLAHNVAVGCASMAIVYALDIYLIVAANDRVLVRTVEWANMPLSVVTMVTCDIWHLLFFRWIDRLPLFGHTKAWLCGVSMTSVVYMCVNHPVIKMVKAILRRLFSNTSLAESVLGVFVTFVSSMAIMALAAQAITRTNLRVILGLKPQKVEGGN